MTGELIAVLTLVAVLVLLVLRVPISVSLAIPSMIGLSLLVGDPTTGPRQLLSALFEAFTRTSFALIPLYLLLGSLAFHVGMTRNLFDAINKIVGGIRGGLAVATSLGSGMFAAVSGSSVATVGAMARTALPEMLRHGYSKRLAAGVIAGAGSVGVLIPPSVILVLYAILAEQSIGRLLVAAIVPGVLSVVLTTVTVLIIVKVKPESAPRGEKVPAREKVRSIPALIPVAIVFAIVVGGIYLGWLQPLESAAVGVVAVLVIGVIMNRSFKIPVFAAAKESASFSAGLLLLIGGAFLLGNLLALSGLTRNVVAGIAGLGWSPFFVLLMFLAVFIVMGMFLDGNTILALTVPLALPVMIEMGYDPIWFGILMVKVVEVAMYSPPVGLNIFTLAAAAPTLRVGTIFRGVVPFAIADIVVIALLIAMPQIALWLPSLAFP